jgi:hypothetical protein
LGRESLWASVLSRKCWDEAAPDADGAVLSEGEEDPKSDRSLVNTDISDGGRGWVLVDDVEVASLLSTSTTRALEAADFRWGYHVSKALSLEIAAGVEGVVGGVVVAPSRSGDEPEIILLDGRPPMRSSSPAPSRRIIL